MWKKKTAEIKRSIYVAINILLCGELSFLQFMSYEQHKTC